MDVKRIGLAAVTAASLLALSIGAGWAEDDATFLKTAIGINLAEIQLGQLAEQKSQNDQVRKYGAMLVKDHQASNQEATGLARQTNVTPPESPSREDQTAFQQLSSMSGKDFDASFLDHMIKGHKTAIDLFTDKSDDAKSDVTAFAKKTLPDLKKHLQTAEDLSKDASVASAGQGQTATGTRAQSDQSSAMSTDQSGTATIQGALASRLIGSSVYASDATDAEKIGDINDLLVAQDGRVESAIIGVGGFLGIAEKNVAVNFSQLKFGADQNGDRRLVLQTTKDDLRNAPAFDTAALDQTNATAANGRRMNGTGNGANSAMGTGDATQHTGTTADNGATQTTNQAARRTDLKKADTASLTAENLLNTTVYGANDENVGEVGDVLMTKDGKIDAVVLDVGGFLGIGEKPVAVAFQDLDIRTDQNGTLYIYSKFTRGQLESGPKYNKDTYDQDRAKMRLRSAS